MSKRLRGLRAEKNTPTDKKISSTFVQQGSVRNCNTFPIHHRNSHKQLHDKISICVRCKQEHGTQYHYKEYSATFVIQGDPQK